MARQDFAKHYGGFMELMYLVCQGDFDKMATVDKWQTQKFLFLAEYLKRKRDVENIL